MTLSDALAAIGISHKASRIPGKRDLFAADGSFIGSFDAFEGWDYLRALGHAHASLRGKQMTALAKISPREKRQDNTAWFSCCGQTWRHHMWWLGRDYCPMCGEVVEAMTADEIEDAQ